MGQVINFPSSRMLKAASDLRDNTIRDPIEYCSRIPNYADETITVNKDDLLDITDGLNVLTARLLDFLGRT